MSEGDVVYGLFGRDSGGDSDRWLINVYRYSGDAEAAAKALMADRPGRMTETVVLYTVQELALL